VEKEYLVQLIQKLSGVYCAEVLGFCALGTHFHLLVRMHPNSNYSDDEIRKRFQIYYGANTKRELLEGQIPSYRKKWESLSEYVREIKQGFSRWYNKRHGRRGFFWGQRFKSVIVEEDDSLINCLAEPNVGAQVHCEWFGA
jgi:putative transposase